MLYVGPWHSCYCLGLPEEFQALERTKGCRHPPRIQNFCASPESQVLTRKGLQNYLVFRFRPGNGVWWDFEHVQGPTQDPLYGAFTSESSPCTYLSICLPISTYIAVSVHLSFDLSIFLSHLSIGLIYQSVCRPIYLSTYLSIYRSIYLSIYLPIDQCIYLSFFPSILAWIDLSADLWIYLSMYLCT